MRARYLLCVLLGVVLATTEFEIKSAIDAFMVLDQRVAVIENYLNHLAQVLSAQ